MNGKWRIAALLMLGHPAWASPVPPPPDGFSGAQYIDGQGCVFSRAEGRWRARLDGAGQPLCGFPPSLGARRQDAAADRVLPLSESAPPDPAAQLMEQLSRELRPGEWHSDPRPGEVRAEPAPATRPSPVQTALQDAIAVAPALHSASGVMPSPEMCAKMGYRPDPTAAGQPALGLCPGMRLDPAVPAFAPVVPASRSRAVASSAAPAVRETAAAPRPAADRRAPAARPKPSAPKPAAPARPAAAKPAKAPDAAKTAAPGAEMIPASARYVSVGRFADGENAMIVLRALAARGYPTAQTRSEKDGKVQRMIMAGPFADLQTLIAALNDLRRNGYAGAVAR